MRPLTRQRPSRPSRRSGARARTHPSGPEVDLGEGWSGSGPPSATCAPRIREATGAERPLIVKQGKRYRARPGVFDVDVWHFQAGLIEANEGPDDEAVEAALERAAGAYRGKLLEGSFYEWAETPGRSCAAVPLMSSCGCASCGKTGATPRVPSPPSSGPSAWTLCRGAVPAGDCALGRARPRRRRPVSSSVSWGHALPTSTRTRRRRRCVFLASCRARTRRREEDTLLFEPSGAARTPQATLASAEGAKRPGARHGKSGRSSRLWGIIVE